MPVLLTDLTDETAPSPESFDAFMLMSFGGPEGPDDVMPFLENVLRGKNVPRERMLEVAQHYQRFGGKSPINEQNQHLLAAIGEQFRQSQIDLPIYWGNRNWHPLVTDTLRKIRDDGKRNVLVFFTSMFSSYSGCRQYRENIAQAQREIGDRAPAAVRLRLGFNHPGFVEAVVDRVNDSLTAFPLDDRSTVKVLFTAHSIPVAMAQGCQYENQLRHVAELVARSCGIQDWELCYQSRSGPPQVPWLEPDICDRIEQLHATQTDSGRAFNQLVIAPLGFISDHMEVIYDLDHEAAALCDRLNIQMQRAATVGTHPSFVRMIVELVEERIGRRSSRATVGNLPACDDICAAQCCTYQPPQRPARV